MLRLFYANYFVFALAADLFTTLDARMERNAEKDVSGDNNNNNNKAEAKAEALKKNNNKDLLSCEYKCRTKATGKISV